MALVNPNNPTGASIASKDIQRLLAALSPSSRLWIDEAYIDYGAVESVQPIAAVDRRLFVVKSLSKAYALSGLRAAYLVGSPDEVRCLREWTPPWWISLPAQLAAMRAIEEHAYYASRYQETRRLRASLSQALVPLGCELREGAGNWVLLRLPLESSARQVVKRCRVEGVFLRNVGDSAPSVGDRVLRIAVKPEREQRRIATTLGEAMANLGFERV